MKKIIILILLITFILFVPGFTKAQTACPTLSGTEPSVVNSINIDTQADYVIWSRISSPNTSNNSYYLQVDNNNCAMLVGDDDSMASNTWSWINYSKNATTTNILKINLTVGSHTIKLIQREPGLKIDKIIFTSNPTCIPTGNGSTFTNCSQTPSPTTGILTSVPTASISNTPVPTSTFELTPVEGSKSTALIPPSNLVAVRNGDLSNQRVNLSWAYNSSLEVKFEIERSTDPSFSGIVRYLVNPNIKSFVDTQIANNTTYYYRVIAISLTGQRSLPSEVKSLRTK